LIIYLDSSALVKRYIQEDESAHVQSLLKLNETFVASELVVVEVRRVLGRITNPIESTLAAAMFKHDLDQVHLIAMTRSLVELAADIAARSQLRSLDSIHLATAVTTECTHFLTFDLKQAQVATTFGLALLAEDAIEFVNPLS